MKFVQLYVILSVSLFIPTFTKLLIRDKSVVDFFVALVKSSKDFFILLNFIFSLIIVLLSCIKEVILGNIPESAKNETSKKAKELAFKLVLFFVFFVINDNGFFLLIPYAIDRVFGFMLAARLSSLLNLPKPPSNGVHYRIIIGEFFLFFINLALVAKCIKTDITSIFSLFFTMAIIENIECIFNHFIYIKDNNVMGNGKSSYLTRIRSEIVFKSLDVILFIIEMFSPNIKNRGLFFTVFIFPDAKELIQKCTKLSMFKYYMMYLNCLLPGITQEDLDKEEVCLICREELTIENGKKLRCGHCYHVECLEKWIIDHETCPMCNTHIIDKNDKQDQQGQGNNLHPQNQQEHRGDLLNMIHEAILRHRAGPAVNGQLNPPEQVQQQNQDQPAEEETNNVAIIFDEKGNEVHFDNEGKAYSIDEKGNVTYYEIVASDEEEAKEDEETIDFNVIADENETVLSKAHKSSSDEKLIKKEIIENTQEMQKEDINLDDDTEEILEAIHALKNSLDVLERRILQKQKKH